MPIPGSTHTSLAAGQARHEPARPVCRTWLGAVLSSSSLAAAVALPAAAAEAASPVQQQPRAAAHGPDCRPALGVAPDECLEVYNAVGSVQGEYSSYKLGVVWAGPLQRWCGQRASGCSAASPDEEGRQARGLCVAHFAVGQFHTVAGRTDRPVHRLKLQMQ